MVNDLLVRYRSLGLFPQALIAGAAFVVLYSPYLYFVNHLTALQTTRLAVSSALLFMSVFYLTSVVVNKKRMQIEAVHDGPKKGLRKS